MNRLLTSVLLALAFAAAAPTAAHAGPQNTRAYAPENLRTLSRDDQTRVIGLEYSEQSRGRRIPDDQLRFYLDQVNRSNWTFSQVKRDIAQSLAGNSGGGDLYPRPPIGNGNVIRCDSNSNKAQRCPTPWRGTSRLVRQVSKSACVEGRSWGSENGLITVWNGCRGEFTAGRSQPGYPGNGHGNGNGNGNGDRYTVICSSTAKNPQSCAWDNRRGSPYVERQISTSRCTENGNWWYDGQAIWVKNGCRAMFGARSTRAR